jgi:hypothetical protein
LLIVVGGGAAAVLLLAHLKTARIRVVAILAALGVLLLAPGSWAVQTLGHATSGTFPAGGPASASFGAGPGGPGSAGAPPAGFPGAGGGLPGGFARPQTQGAVGGGQAQSGSLGAGPGPGGFRGGPFSGDSRSLNSALAYVRQHGGGTLAVSSQSGAAGQLIAKESNLAAIGGFSGRESQVSVDWLADAVEDGRISWVLTDGSGGGLFRDGRIGSSEVMAAVERTCTAIPASSYTNDLTTSARGLYDCRGHAADLRALAS